MDRVRLSFKGSYLIQQFHKATHIIFDSSDMANVEHATDENLVLVAAELSLDC
jgi:hypothetical protein